MSGPGQRAVCFCGWKSGPYVDTAAAFEALDVHALNCPRQAELKREAARVLSTLSTSDLFHRLWTKAVGTPDYDKAEWKELERRAIAPMNAAYISEQMAKSAKTVRQRVEELLTHALPAPYRTPEDLLWAICDAIEERLS